MKITILSLFPQMFKGPFDHSIVKLAQEKGLVEINFIDIRDFGIGRHKTVDDKPYGGGHGMIIRVDVVKKALDHAINPKLSKKEQKVILTSASGETFKQSKARDYSKLKQLIIICGHYEGIDKRLQKFIDEEISIGNFILTGGEIPAMAITDSVVRLINGVLEKEVVEAESFSEEEIIEYPQYTRPRKVGNLEVPKVLLSGNHKKIEEWKRNNWTKKKTT